MKTQHFLLGFLLSLFFKFSATAQWQDYIISVRGDTLNRVDIKGLKQGPWVISVPEQRGNEGYDEQGFFKDDKKEGKWVRFSLMGDKIAEENYLYGVLNGKCKYYTRTGGLLREESWKAIEPGKEQDTVFIFDVVDPSVIVDQIVVKSEGQTYRHGVWTYYDPYWGSIVKTEKYIADQLQKANVDKGTDTDEIKPIEVSTGKKNTTSAKTPTDKKEVLKPQAVLEFEKKTKGKKIKVQDGRTGM